MNGVKSVEHLAFDSSWPAAKILRRSSRRLSLKLGVDGVPIVSAPKSVPARQIKDWLISKQSWLQRQRELYQGAYNVLAGQSLGPTVNIRHRLDPNLSAHLEQSDLVLAHPAQFNQWQRMYIAARESIKRTLNQEAQRTLPALVDQISLISRLRPRTLRVRFMRSRWGSCNSYGDVTLNSQLVRLDLSLIEYVIAHELVHLRHRHHQGSFWDEMARWVPDYKLRRRALKQVRLFD